MSPRRTKNLDSFSILSVSNDLLTYADIIVVPTALRPDILNKIHAGHKEITKCLEHNICLVAGDNAGYQACSRCLRVLSSPQTKSTGGATDDNSSINRTVEEGSGRSRKNLPDIGRLILQVG